MKLSDTQWQTLARIAARDMAYPAIRFNTAEALRLRGLVDRETVYVITRIYADSRGEHVQFTVPAHQAHAQHDWWITPAGRAALETVQP